MIRILFISLLAACLLLPCPSLSAQTNLSGVINTYQEVTAFSLANNRMTLANAPAFASGEEVLIIQMQGATISQSNNSSYGDVTSIGGAGRYELATICEVNGNDIIFDSVLVHANEYNALDGGIQIVSVPRYNQATVTAPLTAAPWDGLIGGVLILRVDGTLRLDAPINLDGLGFRGGGYQNAGSNCNGFFPQAGYSYANSLDGGQKGEGIVDATLLFGSYGKGKLANGGGGGNNHNAGGGGGSNGGIGGNGGENQTSGFGRCRGPHPGVGGQSLGIYPDRLFLGGGGGSGHGNNNLGTGGGAGGGLAILIAGTLQAGNSNLLSAQGIDGANGFSDGAGGGGGGGTFLLSVGNYLGNLSIQANGGDGGSINNENLNFCMGPGAGGGGGVIRSATALPGTVATSLAAGSPGTSFNYSSNCNPSNVNNGARAGGLGLAQSNGTVPRSSQDFSCQPLPVVWGDFRVEGVQGQVELHWQTLSEVGNASFHIERSREGSSFREVGSVAGSLYAQQLQTYQWKDPAPLGGRWYYRIRQVDLDGDFSYSPLLSIQLPEQVRLLMFPNPLQNGQDLKLNGYLPQDGPLHIQLFNGLGGLVYQQLERERSAGLFEKNIQLPQLSPGHYLLKARLSEQQFIFRLIILN
jgi:hypothetical protein